MKVLYTEILKQFPEIQRLTSEGDEEAGYLMMNHLAEWLGEGDNIDADEVIPRIETFVKWCDSQPRGDTAADDILTMLVVGFYEKLFRYEQARKILPRIISKEHFVKSAEYWIAWVGKENYDDAAQYYN